MKERKWRDFWERERDDLIFYGFMITTFFLGAKIGFNVGRIDGYGRGCKDATVAFAMPIVQDLEKNK